MVLMALLNVADNYQPTYEKAQYGDGYLIGIHAVQTALNMQGYGKTQNVNLNSIYYGYYDINTQTMVKQFQKDNHLNITEKIDKKTWDTIFNNLLKQQGCIIAQTGEKEISIIDIDTYIENLNDSGKQNSDSTTGDEASDNREYPNLDSTKTYPASDSGKSYSDVLNDTPQGQRTHPNLDSLNPGMTDTAWYDAIAAANSGKSSSFVGNHNVDGSAMFDDLMYNYIVSGGKYYNGVSYAYNLNGGNYFDDQYNKIYLGDSEKDYDFIYNLLANSIYADGGYYLPVKESKSTTDGLGYYGGSYESSTNSPFFDPSNIDILRKSKFDITIVYGAKGEQARKIRQVTPISVSQEMNASGEPIFDVYEFIARDISYGL
jgi:hypothetical protein